MSPTISYLLTPLVGVVCAWLGYLATRKRDEPTIDLQKRRLELDDSRAALEAWVELVAQVRSDLTTARDETIELRKSMRVLEGQLVTTTNEREDLRQQLERMETRVAELTTLLNDCINRQPKIIRA